jgi:hypothetical protein
MNAGVGSGTYFWSTQTSTHERLDGFHTIESLRKIDFVMKDGKIVRRP